MTAYRVEIEPRAPLHRGIHGHAPKSGAVIHSDTLHAALLASAAVTGAHNDALERLKTLRISSLFPCLRDAYFFPKPYLPLPSALRKNEEQGKDKNPKRWKKVRLVSEAALNAWLLGKTDALANAPEPRGGVMTLKGEFGNGDWPKNKLLQSCRNTGVAVDRHSAAATPYDQNLVWVNTAEGVRLYCLVETTENEAWVREQFERLGWAGLGGNRSSGFGGFKVTACEVWKRNNVNNADMFMTLSLYLPTRHEVDANVLEAPAAYDCALRGGWIHGVAGADKAKHALRLCLEGSVFNKVADQHGEVRDVTPDDFKDHRVWRSGLAFALPFKRAEEEAS